MVLLELYFLRLCVFPAIWSLFNVSLNITAIEIDIEKNAETYTNGNNIDYISETAAKGKDSYYAYDT